jgi:hypothetical protein
VTGLCENGNEVSALGAVKPNINIVQIIKNADYWNATPCGSCKNDVSEERIPSIIMAKRIGELETFARYC